MPTPKPHVSRRSLLMLPLIAGAGLSLAACAAEPEPAPPKPKPAATRTPEPAPNEDPEPTATRMLLLASLAHGKDVAVVDPSRGDNDAVITRIAVGAAPWGVGVHEGTGYAATAEGLAVIDLAAGKRTALVQYQHPANRIEQGEYRPGGLGLAVAPDGSRVYVAVTPDGSSNWLEVFDTAAGAFTDSIEVGLRPFDVLVAPDGSWAATVDHDSFTVTVVDAKTLKPSQYTVAPFGTEGGLASWEKAHYGAVDQDGFIWLPYQGITVAKLDPRTGKFETMPSTANSHAHGTALAGTKLLTVGTGSFGNAMGGANLSILDTATGKEQLVDLDPPHETVAVWHDESGAEFAAVGGGNTREMGWDGITLVSLADLSKRQLAVEGYPQVVVSFASR